MKGAGVNLIGKKEEKKESIGEYFYAKLWKSVSKYQRYSVLLAICPTVLAFCTVAKLKDTFGIEDLRGDFDH